VTKLQLTSTEHLLQAGNQKYDLERAEREAREKFLANRRLRDLETKMKESVAPSPKNSPDTDMTDALTHAAQLVAAPEEEQAEDANTSNTDTNSNSDEEGEVVDQSTQQPTRKGPKQKAKPVAKVKRAKRTEYRRLNKSRKAQRAKKKVEKAKMT
jgi:exosome complex protein LRP1